MSSHVLADTTRRLEEVVLKEWTDIFCLVVWNMSFILPYVICIGNVIIPTDFPLIDHIYIHNPNYIPIYSIYQQNLSIIGSYWIPTDFHSMIFQRGRWLNKKFSMTWLWMRRGRLFSMALRVNHFGWLKNPWMYNWGMEHMVSTTWDLKIYFSTMYIFLLLRILDLSGCKMYICTTETSPETILLYIHMYKYIYTYLIYLYIYII